MAQPASADENGNRKKAFNTIFILNLLLYMQPICTQNDLIDT